MFGFHAPELIILLVVALVIFGPKRLPEIGGAMGKSIKEFRKGSTEHEDHDEHEQPAQITARTTPVDTTTTTTTAAEPVSPERDREVS